MMKFGTALAGFTTTLAAAISTGPNSVVGEGTIRMGAESIRMPKGGLADVIHDTNFKLDTGNQSYLFMDLFSSGPSAELR